MELDQTYDDNHATVITLGSNSGSNKITSVNFEEAFGEFSELRGKGRARRAAKKAQRQANRQQKRMTRIQNRQERKVARKTNRQANRQQRVEARATKKSTRQDARMTRKANRVQSRQDRKAMRQGPEEPEVAMEDEMLDSPLMQEENPNLGISDDSMYQTDTMGAPDESGAETISESYETESGEEPAAYVEETEEWNPYEEADYGFSGEEADSAFSAEINDGGRPIEINPVAMDAAKRLVWNEGMMAKLSNDMNKPGVNTVELQSKFEGHKQRAGELEEMLGQFYSNARGGRGGAKKQVRAAKKAARQELRAAKKTARRSPPPPPPAPSAPAPPADDPISTGQAESDAYEFAGSNGAVTVDIYGNADGLSDMKPGTKQALVGVGIAVGIIALLKVTKVL